MTKDFNFRFITLAIFLMVMSAVIVACSSDKNDEEPVNELIGSWTVVSIDGKAVDDEEYEFKADGTFVYMDKEKPNNIFISTNNRYTVSGNILRMDYSIENGIADDYTIGEYTIKGNTLTYTRTYHDGHGEWDDDDIETIVMKRK